VSACGTDDKAGDQAGVKSSDKANASQQQGDASATEPDLEGIPDVVAEVNGEELSGAEFVDTYTAQFQQLAMQAQSSGQPVDQDQLKQQVLDNMVNGELLVQEAEDRGFDASQQRTDRALQELAEQNGLKTTDEFVAALEKQGMERETIESEVQKQVKIDQLLASAGGDTKPTEQELRALYDDVKKQQEQAGTEGGSGQKLPPYAKVRSQLADQLKSQKESEAVSRLVEDLREKADIQTHL
jgi:peptidyl-prolyl cis-trans isomerase SurA